jgi:hypothetical protein
MNALGFIFTVGICVVGGMYLSIYRLLLSLEKMVEKPVAYFIGKMI